MNAERKITQARVSLVLDQPFFGSLILRLPCAADPSCKTMWTDGKRIGYSPKFVDSLSLAEVEAVLCHEVLHCANGHPWRKDGREHQRWNQACDYAINPLVDGAGMRLPSCALNDPQFAGKSAEWIYGKLPAQPPEGGDGNPQDGGEGRATPGQGDPGGCGEVREDRSSEAEANQSEFEVATLQAAQAAKAMGKLPGGLDRLIDQIKRPAVDWKSALRRFVQQTAKADYSWKQPNRRYLAGGLYLPEMRSEQMEPLVVAVDTSGSIDADLLAQFTAELNAIAAECQPETVHVVYADAKVQSSETFGRGEPITLDPKGGGGTHFGPTFEWVADQGLTPACLVYLTDLAGSFPTQEPDYPVLWASTDRSAAPFGTVLEVRP
jgi:predicted metal-dependent peptidase